jgi:tetratricopeptide (TPR) repeat protein
MLMHILQSWLAVKKTIRDTKGAIADYTKAIELNPQYADAYYNRGNTKSKLGDNKRSNCRLYESDRI